MIESLDNVFVDTAFMEESNIKILVKRGLAEKILWGSDYCIPQFFDPSINPTIYYQTRLDYIRNICSAQQFDQITYLIRPYYLILRTWNLRNH